MPVVVLFHQQNPDVHSCFINTHKAIVTCIHANIHTVSQWLMLNPSKEADQDICPSSCLRKIYRWAIFPVCRVSVTILTSQSKFWICPWFNTFTYTTILLLNLTIKSSSLSANIAIQKIIHDFKYVPRMRNSLIRLQYGHNLDQKSQIY